jgi:hypothetical protein
LDKRFFHYPLAEQQGASKQGVDDGHLIVATAVVLIYSWVRYRKVEKMALITFVLVAVFGGLTIFFQKAKKTTSGKKSRNCFIHQFRRSGRAGILGPD